MKERLQVPTAGGPQQLSPGPLMRLEAFSTGPNLAHLNFTAVTDALWSSSVLTSAYLLATSKTWMTESLPPEAKKPVHREYHALVKASVQGMVHTDVTIDSCLIPAASKVHPSA